MFMAGKSIVKFIIVVEFHSTAEKFLQEFFIVVGERNFRLRWIPACSASALGL
jgi:hypothetical protein